MGFCFDDVRVPVSVQREWRSGLAVRPHLPDTAAARVTAQRGLTASCLRTPELALAPHQWRQGLPFSLWCPQSQGKGGIKGGSWPPRHRLPAQPGWVRGWGFILCLLGGVGGDIKQPAAKRRYWCPLRPCAPPRARAVVVALLSLGLRFTRQCTLAPTSAAIAQSIDVCRHSEIGRARGCYRNEGWPPSH